jgi:hypothetical protein
MVSGNFGATNFKVCGLGEIAGQSFDPSQQALANCGLDGGEVIETGLPQPDLVGIRHVQGSSPSCRFASSRVTQPWRSGVSPVAVASSHSPLCFIRSTARKAASSFCSLGVRAADSVLSSAKDMLGSCHGERNLASRSLWLLLAFPGSLTADTLFLNKSEGAPGGLITADVKLLNERRIVGMQFDLKIPGGQAVPGRAFLAGETDCQINGPSLQINGPSLYLMARPFICLPSYEEIGQ